MIHKIIARSVVVETRTVASYLATGRVRKIAGWFGSRNYRAETSGGVLLDSMEPIVFGSSVIMKKGINSVVINLLSTKWSRTLFRFGRTRYRSTLENDVYPRFWIIPILLQGHHLERELKPCDNLSDPLLGGNHGCAAVGERSNIHKDTRRVPFYRVQCV
ncbi:uncharacterized protein LY79DRAFT_552167, partial [Colletotrichum navitas]